MKMMKKLRKLWKELKYRLDSFLEGAFFLFVIACVVGGIAAFFALFYGVIIAGAGAIIYGFGKLLGVF